MASRRAAIALGLGGVLIVVGLVAASVRRPVPPTFPLRAIEGRPVPAGLAGPDTVTVDARSAEAWVRFDLARRRVAAVGEPWDIAVRRHRLIVNGGEGFAGQAGVVRLGDPFPDVVEVPAEGYEPTRLTPDRDSVHDALDDWYDYGFFSHLLMPAAGTWAVRTADGRYAKLAIVGYYCLEAEAGCMTFTYAYQGDGTRTVAAR